MGSALARTFLKQGYRTHVWNRTRSRSEPLAAEGAELAETVPDAVAMADIVVVNVDNYATSNRLLRTGAVEDRLQGKLLLQLTTGTPKQSREMADWAQKQQAPYLDGAIMVTPDLIGTPECKILYAGPASLFEKHKPVLEVLGGSAIYLGADSGAASTLDSAMLSFFWGCIFGAHQAIALCQAEGFSLTTLDESLGQMVPFVQRNVSHIAGRVQTQNFKADLATVGICQQSAQLLIEQSKESGVNYEVLETFNNLYQRAVDAGHKQDDFAVLNNYFRSGPQPLREAVA